MLKVGMWWMGLLWKVIDEDLECGCCEMGEGQQAEMVYISIASNRRHISRWGQTCVQVKYRGAATSSKQWKLDGSGVCPHGAHTLPKVSQASWWRARITGVQYQGHMCPFERPRASWPELSSILLQKLVMMMVMGRKLSPRGLARTGSTG
jgi:hypothetical protein